MYEALCYICTKTVFHLFFSMYLLNFCPYLFFWCGVLNFCLQIWSVSYFIENIFQSDSVKSRNLILKIDNTQTIEYWAINKCFFSIHIHIQLLDTHIYLSTTPHSFFLIFTDSRTAWTVNEFRHFINLPIFDYF